MKRFKYSALIILMILMACAAKKSNVKEKNAETNKVPEQVERKDRIAVLDFKTINLPADKSRVISEIIRTDLINTDRYIVIERSQVDMIFKEHGFTSTGVTDDSSAVKIGKLLTAQKILIGSVMKLGESIVVTARIVDVEKGVAEHSGKITAENDESLVSEVSNLVPMLTGAAVESTEVKSSSIVLKTSKRIYTVGEDIVVTYKNFPGTRYDYISLAKEGESPRNHYTYQYTRTNREGTITFYSGVNAAGKYEVRAHTNYYKGDIQPTAVLKFTVK